MTINQTTGTYSGDIANILLADGGEPNVRLFNRKYTIEAGGIQVVNKSLRCAFKVKRNLKSNSPNSCSLSIWGLTKATRDALEQIDGNFTVTSKKIAFVNTKQVNLVRIEAGYEDGTQQIYYGETRSASTKWNGPECVTTLSSGDGEKQLQQSRISVPVGPGTTVTDAMRHIIAVTGLGEGNLKNVVQNLEQSGFASVFVQGSAFYGCAFDELDHICKGANLEWSVQNGKLQFLNKGQALSQNAFLLQSGGAGGMIDSPIVDKSGILKVRTLMVPHMYPGRLITFDTKDVQGTWRVEQCEYSGDTWTKEWYIDSHLSRISTVPQTKITNVAALPNPNPGIE